MPKLHKTPSPSLNSSGIGRFTTEAWKAIETLEKELKFLGCKRLVLQPGKKFYRALAYREESP